jgi:hypothetical protein
MTNQVVFCAGFNVMQNTVLKIMFSGEIAAFNK